MENTQTAHTTHNGIVIYRSNVVTRTQAHTNKNPMAWVIYDNNAPWSFKTLKAAKEAIDQLAAKYAGYATTDFKGNFFTRGAVDGQFAEIQITHEEWKELVRSIKAGK